jgi:Xaa-Pro aminopeptidase
MLDAHKHVQGAEVVIDSDLTKAVAKLIRVVKPKKITYDPKEWDVYSFDKLKNKTKTSWRPKPDLSHQERIIKSPKEIKMLERAVRLGAQAFEAFARDINANGFGTSERQLFVSAEAAMRGENNKALSFEPIVAIGANAANPHACPTAASLHEGDLLLFDAGLKHKRYCSDRTRTVQTGQEFDFDIHQRFKSRKIQKAYDTVLKAHDKAIAKARSGMHANEIDAIARRVIEKAGYGKYFVHSTGHGVGLDIHELPVISSRSRTKIKNGMVYTIEPGIYIPGKFGIRIEDMVVMEDGRARVL